MCNSKSPESPQKMTLPGLVIQIHMDLSAAEGENVGVHSLLLGTMMQVLQLQMLMKLHTLLLKSEDVC
jgi:hypothetical protein